MKNQFQLQIKSPCNQDYNSFKPTEQGGFCNSCIKEVVDFTTFTDEEIAAYFKNRTNDNICGRFTKQQLDQPTYHNTSPKRINLFARVGLALLSFFSFGIMKAQIIKPKPEILPENNSKSIIIGLNKDIVVKGNVTSSEDKLPLPGVNVYLEGTDIGTQTDFDGNFEFPEKLKQGDVLVFSFIGMETRKVVIQNQNSANKITLKLDMEDETYCVVVGEVAVKKIYSSKKEKN